jgi:hypothetical protein
VILISSGIIFGMISYSKLSKSFRIVVLLLIVTLISEIIAFIFSAIVKNNCPVYHFFNPIQYALIGSVFYFMHKATKVIKWYVVISILILAIYTISKITSIEKLYSFPTHVLMLESIMILFLVVFSFRIMLNDEILIPLHHRAMFWFNLGLMFFFTSTFMFWSLFQTLLSFPDIHAFTKQILVGLNYFLYGCIFIALIKDSKSNIYKKTYELV